jgi:hypothetical protein
MLVAGSYAVLAIRAPLLGCFAEPVDSLRVVPLSLILMKQKQMSEVLLRIHMALLRGLPKPLESLLKVSRYAPRLLVADSQVVLGVRLPLMRCHTVQLKTTLHVLWNTPPVLVAMG